MAIPFHIPTPEETEISYRLIYQLLNDMCDLLRQIVIGRQLPVPPQPAQRNRTNGTRRADVAEQQQQRLVQYDDLGRVVGEVPSLPDMTLPDIVLSTLSSAVTTTSPRTAHSRSNNSSPAISSAISTTSSTTSGYTITGQTTTETASRSSSCTCSSEQQQASQPPQRPPRRRRRASRVPTKISTAQFNHTVREDWVKVGDDLRKIADDFRATLQDAKNRKPPSKEQSAEAQISLLSLLLPAPLRGSLWTAVILLLGWKLFQAAF